MKDKEVYKRYIDVVQVLQHCRDALARLAFEVNGDSPEKQVARAAVEYADATLLKSYEIAAALQLEVDRGESSEI